MSRNCNKAEKIAASERILTHANRGKTTAFAVANHRNEHWLFWPAVSVSASSSQYGSNLTVLGADEATMPLLWLAGPMTGLIIQPIVGAMSDHDPKKYRRRTAYFLIGAIICTISLFLMPYSSTLSMAASLLWLLDAGNNITMEPYRAYVADRLVSGTTVRCVPNAECIHRAGADSVHSRQLCDGVCCAGRARRQWHPGNRPHRVHHRRYTIDLDHCLVGMARTRVADDR